MDSVYWACVLQKIYLRYVHTLNGCETYSHWKLCHKIFCFPIDAVKKGWKIYGNSGWTKKQTKKWKTQQQLLLRTFHKSVSIIFIVTKKHYIVIFSMWNWWSRFHHHDVNDGMRGNVNEPFKWKLNTKSNQSIIIKLFHQTRNHECERKFLSEYDRIRKGIHHISFDWNKITWPLSCFVCAS